MYSVNLSQPVVPRDRIQVTGAQGVMLSVQEWGNPNGQAILFAHAYGMSHLAWLAQVTSDLAQEFRLVTFDHRGHGESDKPLAEDSYNQRDLFADDIQAIITQLNLKDLVLVGHSMSGVLVGDYLMKYGDRNVVGVVLVGANNKLGAEMFQTQIGAAFVAPKSQAIFSESLYEQIGGWNFLNRHLTTDPTNKDVQDIILATSVLMPMVARKTIAFRDENYLSLYQNLNAPILLVHAKDDQIVLPAAPEQLKEIRPDVAYSLYEMGGHAPHWENAERFNQELAQFVHQAVQKAMSQTISS
jgi:pimeloyl-ACP methyl ester carboxylesterase